MSLDSLGTRVARRTLPDPRLAKERPMTVREQESVMVHAE